ncbi:hypothetical protein KGQ72_03355, partial [Patescibacteria group bacterium]|nr:hypothetical protein [Patescibacteria group bacterium]
QRHIVLDGVLAGLHLDELRELLSSVLYSRADELPGPAFVLPAGSDPDPSLPNSHSHTDPDSYPDADPATGAAADRDPAAGK